MSQNVFVQDIDASLTYGQIFSSRTWKNVIVFMYIAIGIVLAIIVAMLIGVPLTIGVFDRNSLAFIIGGSVCVVILVLSTVILQKFFNNGKRKAKLWLDDAVILEAQAKPLGQTLHIRGIMARTATAIEVRFIYDGIQCIRQSTYKDRPLYLAVYTKYADKKITIAYSPKYDEVMLIKPQSAQRIKDSNNNTK